MVEDIKAENPNALKILRKECWQLALVGVSVLYSAIVRWSVYIPNIAL